MADDSKLEDFDDFDEDEFLAEWDEADRQAATVLREAIPDVLDSEPPMGDVSRVAEQLRAEIAAKTREGRYFANACGWTEPPDVPLALWLQAAGSTISPWDDPGTDPELQADVFSMGHADWLALIVGLVRRGVGAELDAEQVVDDLLEMPEVNVDVPPERDEYALTVEVLAPLWQALEAIDDDRRLTPLGRWGLPRALYLAWSTSDMSAADV